jgi:formamidopyrimidine-DNA glycosylase
VPELPEVEAYREMAERALGRRIRAVRAPDDWYLKRGLDASTLARALRKRKFTAARRIGKLLLLDTAGDVPGARGAGERGEPVGAVGPTLGLRFGMTGRLLVDGRAGVDQLLYSSLREEQRWDRFIVRFEDGGDLRVRDPRRLGGVELEPDEARLGPDARSLTLGQLRAVVAQSSAPLKARLMDQARLAGAGNLITDEALWRAGLAPARPAGSLSPPELRRLHRGLRSTIDDLMARGGSHTGKLLPERRPGGRCPRDGAELLRATVGGRTTWWCPLHQS